LTDINVLAGRLDPTRFALPIDVQAARDALDALTEVLADDRDADEALDGLLARADRRMADAIGRVSLRQGCDPGDYVLVAFGGAGAQHACAVAEALDMDEVLLPSGASVLSAEGIAEAAIERIEIQQVLRPLDEVNSSLEQMVEEITARAVDHVIDFGVDRTAVQQLRVIVHVRLQGQDATIDLDWTSSVDLVALFRERFTALYGYGPGDRAIEVESIHVLAGTSMPCRDTIERPVPVAYAGSAETQQIRFDGQWTEGQIIDRDGLSNGDYIVGPALLCNAMTTVVLPPAWSSTC